MIVDDDFTGISVVESSGADLASSVREAAAQITGDLAGHGAVLMRGCATARQEDFQKALIELDFSPMEYTERSTPRSMVADGVFTSTDYPARKAIPQHCESSYSNVWPGRLAFFCATPPAEAGATPIADVAAVARDLDERLLADLTEGGLMYVRNYGNGVGLDWRTAFQADNQATVERYCAANGLEWEWLPEDCLRTTRCAAPLSAHPRTGVPIWFNHLVLFHQSALDQEVREALIDMFGEDRLPNDVRRADGSAIPDPVVDAVRAVIGRHTRRFGWQAGDLLVIDNMRWSHGREPYTAPRRILVSMSDPCTGS
jgi:Taurine catabolism dioxygenase TauD, TfdA family